MGASQVSTCSGQRLLIIFYERVVSNIFPVKWTCSSTRTLPTPQDRQRMTDTERSWSAPVEQIPKWVDEAVFHPLEIREPTPMESIRQQKWLLPMRAQFGQHHFSGGLLLSVAVLRHYKLPSTCGFSISFSSCLPYYSTNRLSSQPCEC